MSAGERTEAGVSYIFFQGAEFWTPSVDSTDKFGSEPQCI